MFWNKIASVVATNTADVLLKVFSGFTLTNVQMLFLTEKNNHPSPAHICHLDVNWQLLIWFVNVQIQHIWFAEVQNADVLFWQLAKIPNHQLHTPTKQYWVIACLLTVFYVPSLVVRIPKLGDDCSRLFIICNSLPRKLIIRTFLNLVNTMLNSASLLPRH